VAGSQSSVGRTLDEQSQRAVVGSGCRQAVVQTNPISECGTRPGAGHCAKQSQFPAQTERGQVLHEKESYDELDPHKRSEKQSQFRSDGRGRRRGQSRQTKPISPAAGKPVGQALPDVQDVVRGRTTYEERIVRNKPNFRVTAGTAVVLGPQTRQIALGSPNPRMGETPMPRNALRRLPACAGMTLLRTGLLRQTNPIPGGEKVRASAFWQKGYDELSRRKSPEKQSQMAVAGSQWSVTSWRTDRAKQSQFGPRRLSSGRGHAQQLRCGHA
jgi:hypothetical protein